MSSVAEAQFALLERMAELDPVPCLMGGYAEDALLAGTVTRPHVDIDWLVPRSELPRRIEQAAALGFGELETWGDSVPGEPFYLFGERGELKLEIGVTDDRGGRTVVRIHKLYFEIDGGEPPAGYQFPLPADVYVHPRAELDGLALRIASPLTLYQLRAAIASKGSFGPLSERQLETMSRLREKFFPDRSEEELLPPIEPLSAS